MSAGAPLPQPATSPERSRWVGAGAGLRPGDPVCQGVPSPLSNPSQTSRGGGGGGGRCSRPAPHPARAPLRARRPWSRCCC